MVVPLKLTQFYGHSVPRPRIYADVKFSEQRVDPPPSVNEALLSWAADANWSMGGLSLKRLRGQGKLEGSARRLRAQPEEEEEEEVEAECHGGDDKTKIVAKKAGASGGLGEKGKRDEEAVGAASVKKLRKKEMDEKDGETETSGSVSVSQEKKKSSKVRSIFADASEVISASKQKKKGVQPVKGLSFVPATAERRQSKASDLILDGAGPLTRSAKKQPFDQSVPASPQQQPKRGRLSVRKALLSDKPANHGGDSSDSDDGLEGILEQKNRPPLRRSSRLIHESLKSLKHDSSELDSDSA